MKNVRVTLLLLVCTSVVHAEPRQGKGDRSSGSSQGGVLHVDSATQGAEVFVDGESIGKVPLPGPVPLSSGEHTIKVTKPGYAPMIDVFMIGKRHATKLDIELVPVAAVLRVGASVDKARVFVDGKFVGEVPLVTELEVGARAVQVSKGGYRDFFQNVSAIAGAEVALDVKLEELPVGENPYKLAPAAPRRWYEKWWVWTIVGVAAAGVGVGVGVGVSESRKDVFSGIDRVLTAN